MKQHVLVLGGGAWGTAVATVLAHNGHDVLLWCREAKVAATINAERQNSRYLPGVILPSNLVAVSDLAEAFSQVTHIFEAVPVAFMREVLTSARAHARPEQTWIMMSKGIESETLSLPTDILTEVMGAEVKVAVLGGPNFAKEVARKDFSGTVIASPDRVRALEICALLENDYFKPVVGHDMIGIQIAGAIKNVIALGVGMTHGQGAGPNAAAFLITQGLHEMAALAHALGGRKETLFGLGGIGDLILTATGQQSRNLQAGIMLGQGKTLEQVKEALGVYPEGVNSCRSLSLLIARYGLHMPFCHAVCDVLAGTAGMSELLTRAQG